MSEVTKWGRGDGVALVEHPALAKILVELNLGISIEPSPRTDPSVEVVDLAGAWGRHGSEYLLSFVYDFSQLEEWGLMIDIL
nr:hypothetical protein Iba_chr09eCG12300 [Ipomoea batatas]